MKRFLKADKDTRGVKTSTVMFVPSSKVGTLISMLKEREDTMVRMTKFRVKFQEAGGVKLDLAAGAHCGRDDCIPCIIPDKRQNCKRQSILYESSCQLCNKDQDTRRPEPSHQEASKGIYFGESSRSLYERSKEHFRDAGDFSGGSHLVEHWMTTHPEDDQCPPFRIKVIGS